MPRRIIDDIVREQDLLAVAPDASVREAVQEMSRRHVAAALVLEGDVLRGIFTERDLLQRVVATGLDPDATPVARVMSSEPVTVEAREQGIEAMRAMTEFGIRHVVVIGRSGAQPYGILSIRDFVGAELASYERELEFQQRLWEAAW